MVEAFVVIGLSRGLSVFVFTEAIDALARHLQPAYERLHAYLLGKDVLGADETTWSLLGHRGKPSKRWYTWALCADDAVLYRLDESRSAEAARKIIGDFDRTLVSDGYTGYHALKKQGGRFRIALLGARAKEIHRGRDQRPSALLGSARPDR